MRRSASLSCAAPAKLLTEMSKAPAKRAKKAAAPEVPVSTLVARCSREALEGLIESKIASGRALERADLLALLPETHHSAVVAVPRREVTTGAVREAPASSTLSTKRCSR